MKFPFLIPFLFIIIISCQSKKQEITEKTDHADSSGYASDTVNTSTEFTNMITSYEDPDRGNWQNPELVIQKLGSLKGKYVADIGAGTGYFSFRIANQANKVIAIDIEEKFLEYIEEKKTELSENLDAKIETRLARSDDPLLKEKEVDIVLIVNTIAFIKNRPAYFEKVKRGLKKNGFLLIVDFKEGDMPVGPTEEFKVKDSKAMEELGKAGFTEMEKDTKSLQYQYIIKAR